MYIFVLFCIMYFSSSHVISTPPSVSKRLEASAILVRRLQTGFVALYLTFFSLLLPQSEACIHGCMEGLCMRTARDPTLQS